VKITKSEIVGGLIVAAGGIGIYEMFFKPKWVPLEATSTVKAGTTVAMGQPNASPATVAFANTIAASGALKNAIVSGPGGAPPTGFPSNDGLGNAAVRLIGVMSVDGPISMGTGAQIWVKV